MKQHKFQQSVSPNIYDQLIVMAKEHGCTSVQELIRSVVIPEMRGPVQRSEKSRLKTAREYALKDLGLLPDDRTEFVEKLDSEYKETVLNNLSPSFWCKLGHHGDVPFRMHPDCEIICHHCGRTRITDAGDTGP